ncbi:MAG: ATP-NAD kinase family protein [Pseudomonadota bacterium]
MTDANSGGDPAQVLGLVVNPVAGLGGTVALKGTDGTEIASRALLAGAKPQAGERARRAVAAFLRDGGGAILTGPGDLGGDAAPSADVIALKRSGTARDTAQLVNAMQGRVGLILFAGGDGTARDVVAANRNDIPILGIPAGVKMHSGVFSRTPERAGQVAAAHLSEGNPRVDVAEVMDIDEEERRRDRLSAHLYAMARTPAGPTAHIGPKAGSDGDSVAEIDAALAAYVREMNGDTLYLIGPGMTMAALKQRLGGGTLLGIDAARDGRIVARDLTEADILALLTDGDRARVVLTVIGGQGFLLGRGNQQLSPSVIRRVGADAIDVICTASKLAGLTIPELSVDTGDVELDRELTGFRQVITGPGRRQVVRLAA